MGFSLEELRAMGPVKLAFDKAMQYPIDLVGGRCKQMQLDQMNLEIEKWPDNEATQDIKDALKGVDPDFSKDVRSWGKFPPKMPVLHREIKHHRRHHSFFTEFTKCTRSDCVLGCTIRTPETKDGILREKVLCRIDCPVADKDRKGHFVPYTRQGRSSLVGAWTLLS